MADTNPTTDLPGQHLDPLLVQDVAQAVLAPPAKASIFLTVTVRPGREDEVVAALADVPALKRGVGFRVPENDLTCVVGIGAEAWARLYPHIPAPEQLHPFQEIRGEGDRVAVSTPGDLLFHLRAARFDMCFSLAQHILERFGDAVVPVDETHGFRSWDERDLLGFVDGTENPERFEAVASALIPGGTWRGGSYVITQRYLHNLTAWNARTVEQQEKVIGRSKLSDIEQPDGVQALDSHVAANQLYAEDGSQLQIVRDNLPFGNASAQEFGTYFIGYANDPRVTEQMLRNMFVGRPVGNYDKILDFSTAVSGTLYFVPPADFLDSPDDFAPGQH